MDAVLIAAVGILIGGIVNALADDLPHGRWPRRPRYADGSPRPIYAGLGVTAILVGVWQSQPPCPRLSWRYPLTELALAALLLITQTATGSDGLFPGGQRLIWQAYAALFVLLVVVDLERKRILMAPTIVAAALALVDAALLPQPAPNLASALVGGLCGGLIFSVIFLGGRLFRRLLDGVSTSVFGKGDVYLMGLGGLILGFPSVLAAMLLTIALGGAGAALYLSLLRLQKREYKRYTALSYAPYILSAIYFVLLFQDEISGLLQGLPI